MTDDSLTDDEFKERWKNHIGDLVRLKHNLDQDEWDRVDDVIDEAEDLVDEAAENRGDDQ